MTLLTRLFGKKTPAAPERHGKTRQIALTLAENTDKVIFKNLVLDKPENSGDPMIDFGNLTLKPGDRMMLSGPAGCGKSSGLCALKGAWTHGGSGSITVPPEVRFVPQEDYFSDLTLRGLVCAPDDASQYSDAAVAGALREAGLGEFVGQMDDETKKGEEWKGLLSGGQKKKVAIAGAFLHAPSTKVLILDEVTSALDAEAEAELYPKLLEKMRHGIVISIIHRLEIAPQHNVFAKVADGKVAYTRTGLPVPLSKAPVLSQGGKVFAAAVQHRGKQAKAGGACSAHPLKYPPAFS